MPTNPDHQPGETSNVMKVQDFTRPNNQALRPQDTIGDAAQLMSQCGTGALLVKDGPRVAGIVTDRDLVVRAMAKHLPLDTRVDSIMSMYVVSIPYDSDVRDAVKAFGDHAVRRLPVIQGNEVVGVLSVDDLMIALAHEFNELVRGVTGQLMFPHSGDPAATPATIH
jgi:signal-transduction protein with cAMP-binding, CBS, and nucleotidyltransferase domain